MAKKIVLTLIKVGFLAAVFYYLFTKKIDINELLAAIQQLDKTTLIVWIGLGAAVKMCGIMAGVVRWRILLEAQGVHIPFMYMIKCWFMGRVLGLVTPGTLGLDGYRLVESSVYTKEPIKCTTVIAVEKLTGFIALFGLVFLTVPLGLRLFPINMALLAVVLFILASIIAVCMLLLMQPRIIQVLVAVLPVPGAIRSKVNKLGDAATAYGTNKTALLKALFFGFCVHFAIIAVYFCTANAVAASNTSMLDVLFASPLIIVGSVFAPTVSGMGVREIVMTTMLGPSSGETTAFLFGHLGYWAGEVIPFFLSLPIVLLMGRPNRDELLEDIEKVRAAASKHTDREDMKISEEEISFYRGKVFSTVAFGIFGGAYAGAIIALLESFWLQRTLTELSDSGMYLWGAIVYSIIFAGVGVGVCGGLLFLYLLFNRFTPMAINFGLCLGGTFAAGGLVIGLFRYQRDVLQGHAFTAPDMIRLLALVFGTALVLFVLGAVLIGILNALTRSDPKKMIFAGLVLGVLFVVSGGVIGAVRTPENKKIAFESKIKATGPNIILVAIDTLRADYLPMYNPQAVAKTPNLEAFTKDSVLFKYGYAQASWTKPSFATMFTGLYPESHTATTKTAIIPDSVETLAELLRDGGYYTKGFPNNPNVSSVFNFGQGFVEYTYLDPSLYFGASSSAEKLSLYQVLRSVYQKVGSKLGMKMVVTDFYQPAETVTQHGLDWIDSGAVPEGNPFYLYLHYMDPHDPFMDEDAPAGGYARVRMGDPDPEAMKENGVDIIADMKRAYNKEIEHLDRYLGELVAGLKQRGLYENSLILLTADHGEEFYDHKSWWHGRTLYEELCRIPYIIKLPDMKEAGTQNGDFARHVDIAPTFLHFAGIAPSAKMPGKSLYDSNTNVFTNGLIPYVYSENDFEGNILKAVHGKDQIKLITANEDNPRGLASCEMYNLVDDYLEQNNLCPDPAQDATKAALQQEIASFQDVIKNNAAEKVNVEGVSSEVQEQLGGLGYLE